jgi:tetratricopeptide (TPR) repeat protein
MDLRRRIKKTLLWVASLILLTGTGMWSAAQTGQDALNPASALGERLQAAPLEAGRRASLRDAVKGHNYGLAENILLEEIGRNPKSQPLLTLLGGIFFLDGKYFNSAIALKKAKVIAPLDDRSRFTLAMAHITLGKMDWARPELERLAQSDPHNALYPYWLCCLDYHDMHLSSAVANAQKAITLGPKSTKAYDNLGLYYLNPAHSTHLEVHRGLVVRAQKALFGLSA